MSKSIATKNPTSRHRLLSLLVLGLSQALLVSASGCRSTSDNQIDLLERELRVQEDYIYELEGYVVDYSDKLRDCRGCSPSQTAVYSEEVYQSEPTRNSSKKAAPHRTKKERSIVDNPKEDLPSPEDDIPTDEISPEEMEVPEIDLEMEDPVTGLDDARTLQQVAAVELDYESAEGKPLLIPDPVGFGTEDEVAFEEQDDLELGEQGDAELFVDEQPEETSLSADRIAERLEVKHLFRGAGEESAPENLLTVVEALDENDEPVDLNGEVSLMVMTPDKTGQLKRLKRWNFTPAETVAAWQSSDLGDGLHLELPLEEIRLPNAPLELWVRLVTADNQKLLSKLPFETHILSDLGERAPRALPAGSSLAKAKPTSDNPLRNASQTIPTDDRLELAQKETPADQPRWRSSMQRTDRTNDGFATTSGTVSGWTKQAPGRLPYRQATAANRPSTTDRTTRKRATSKPVWAAGRSLEPTVR